MEIGGVLVGLGNPGSQYAATRHNLGFLTLEAFLKEMSKEYRVDQISASKFNGVSFKLAYKDCDWICAFPQTFMNLSGDCVQPLLAWYKTEPGKLFVIHDELDLLPGRIQLKKGGGNAGHNGLKSISARLGTQDYFRLRMGIGRPKDSAQVSSYVLSGFGPDKEAIDSAIEQGVQGLKDILELGTTKAMNKINIKKKD